MKDRKVNGAPVVYTPACGTFVAKDGKTYKAVPDMGLGLPCGRCDFLTGMGLCGRYRCIASDRDDGIGVHFVRVIE